MTLMDQIKRKIKDGKKLIEQYLPVATHADPHLDIVLKSLALFAVREDIAKEKHIDKITASFLDNCRLEYGLHPSICRAVMSGDENITIPEGTLVYANGFLKNKYDTHYNNIKLEKVSVDGYNLQLVFTIGAIKNLNNIKVFCGADIMSNIFPNNSYEIMAQIENRSLYTTECNLKVDHYHWADILYAPNVFSSFTITKLDTRGLDKELIINIKLNNPANYSKFDFSINLLLLENSFEDTSEMIYINKPGKYVIPIDSSYEFLRANQLLIDNNIAHSIGEDNGGWYITRSAGSIFINIQEQVNSTAIIKLQLSNRKCNFSNPYFQESNGCQLTLLKAMTAPLIFTQKHLGPLMNSIRLKDFNIDNMINIIKSYPNFNYINFPMTSVSQICPGISYGRSVPIVKQLIYFDSDCNHVNLKLSLGKTLEGKYMLNW